MHSKLDHGANLLINMVKPCSMSRGQNVEPSYRVDVEPYKGFVLECFVIIGFHITMLTRFIITSVVYLLNRNFTARKTYMRNGMPEWVMFFLDFSPCAETKGTLNGFKCNRIRGNVNCKIYGRNVGHTAVNKFRGTHFSYHYSVGENNNHGKKLGAHRKPASRRRYSFWRALAVQAPTLIDSATALL